MTQPRARLRSRDDNTMKSTLICPLLAAVVFSLAGCGWLTGDDGAFRDRSQDYRRAELDAPLAIPPGLDSSAIDDALAIPTGRDHVPLSGEFVVPRPEALDGDPSAELVRIQRLGSDRWILVEIEPGEVWPRVRQFLNTNQLMVGRVDAAAGLIETVWLQPRDAGRERYRFRIEQGVQRGSSEVFVLQADATTGERWPQRSSNDSREADMVTALAQFLANSNAEGVVSMLAQRGLASRGKVILERGESPALRLQLSGERAWASLELALPKAGFAVEDRDREQAQFLVRYAPPLDEEDEKGWFDWLFGDDDELLDDAETIYLLTMTDGAPGRDVLIRIRRENGEPLSAADAEQLLQLIKGHLS